MMIGLRGGSTPGSTPIPTVVNLKSAFSKISEPWSPRVAGDVNEFQVKLARMEGKFVWHHHENEDELFLVTRGTMRMLFRNGVHRDVLEGELIVVPKGMEHCPMAMSDSVDVVLLERASTLNTGSAAEELGDTSHEMSQNKVPLTKTNLERIG